MSVAVSWFGQSQILWVCRGEEGEKGPTENSTAGGSPTTKKRTVGVRTG